MSLIEDAIQLLSDHPEEQAAVRNLASEYRILKAESEREAAKHKNRERQLEDIRAMVKAPEHAPLTEEERQRRKAELFSQIESRVLKES
jgi:hypothetical protein